MQKLTEIIKPNAIDQKMNWNINRRLKNIFNAIGKLFEK